MGNINNIVNDSILTANMPTYKKLQTIFYVTEFNNARKHILLILIDSNFVIYGNIKLFFEKDIKYGYIHDLYISNSIRNNKYATYLIQLAENIIYDLGYVGIFINVEKDTWLNNWYKKIGYVLNNEDNNILIYVKKFK